MAAGGFVSREPEKLGDANVVARASTAIKIEKRRTRTAITTTSSKFRDIPS